MGISLRERRRLLLREEMLQTAARLMADKGYAGFSMEDVAVEVGVSKPTLYSHFETKDDLLAAAMAHRMQTLHAEFAKVDPEATPLQRLLFLLRLFVKRQIADGAQLRPWSPELFGLICTRADTIELLRSFDSMISQLVTAAIAHGEINPTLDPPTVVRSFYGLMTALHAAPFVNGQPDPERAADTIVTLFQQGVRVPNSPSF
jgi:AcrR family transcriptional regulator